ncbi:MAG: glutamate--tRNA ligase [Candidatus Bathyarchaeota archaeon]|nr:MAG: glutamate--tRNA ligase [Candidatus Bathyarchaeota archaeon]
MSSTSELRRAIKRIALLNAFNHDGKAQLGPVIGKLFAEMPHLKARIKEITPLISEIIEGINRQSLEDQKRAIKKHWPSLLVRKKVEEEKKLPPLPSVEKYGKIRTRFSPNPDAPIHLGSARAIVLCHEYAKIYEGEFIARFEDTDPKQKKPQLPFYDSIKEDLRWLHCDPHKYFIQSDRLQIYYRFAEQLLREGNAYVCTCRSAAFKKLIEAKSHCQCRNLSPKGQLERWQKMLNGTYKEGEAVIRVKTDLAHPNPAVRDWPALRIIDTKSHPHPRVGDQYRVWPLYNFACGIDDHLLGITHIIRGKEHLTNQTRQEYMYRYLGWEYPETIHYGRMKITGTSLSKSKIIQGVYNGTYKSWDDPRLATFAALRRRGIQAEAIKRLIFDVGPKTQDVTLSWDNLYAHNRKIIEPKANRYFFVHNPLRISVNSLPKSFKVKIALHPDFPQRGFRQFDIKSKDNIAAFWIAAKDARRMKKKQIIRLMELFNIKIVTLKGDGIIATFHSQEYEKAKQSRAALIHWIPEGREVKCQIMMPDASVALGLAEEDCSNLRKETIVQFERFGFVRIDSNKDAIIHCYYCHR